MKLKRPRKQPGRGKNAFVLMIGDEGGILAHLQNNKIVKRIFVASPEKEYLQTMNELLGSNPNAPITLVVDMMDQSYVRQTLPPVSSFNVGKIIRRRLSKDFAAEDIKGYVIFGRDKKGRKDWNYIMASLANPPLLQKWIDFTLERPNPFKGLGLVPIECQQLIKAVDAAYLAKAEKNAKSTEWHILISHHKVGGFRQVVLKNGQLMFTRLAQLVGEPTPEVIAGNIEQEMLNTLEYLKRLGLQDTGTLTATIVASRDIKAAFDPKAIRVGQCHFFTPYELATLLALNEVAKPEDHFGDVIIAGFIGKRRKLLLKLFTPYIKKIAKISSYLTLARALAGTIALAILVWVGLTGNDLLNRQQAGEDFETQQKSLNAQYNAENDKKRSLPADVNTYGDVAALFMHYYKPTYDPLYFVRNVYHAISGLALVKSYQWSVPGLNNKAEDARLVNAEFETILLTPPEPRAAFVANAQKLVESIKKTFLHYEVTNSDLPGVLSDTKELKTVVNDTGIESSAQADMQNNTIKFTIKGPSAKSSNDPSDNDVAGNLNRNKFGINHGR